MVAACALGLPAGAAHAGDTAEVAIERQVRSLPAADRELSSFYRGRSHRPLWTAGGRLHPEARRVLDLVQGAAADGLRPADYRASELARALTAAEAGSAADLARAEMLLSAALSAYARDLRRPSHSGILYVDKELAPRTPTRVSVLQQLAAAPSLRAGVDAATRLNPLYNELRDAYAADRLGGRLSREQEGRALASLERLRALPADLGKRFILVDAASARLWMYENGRPAGSMKVVIGRPGEQTPIMAAYVRHLALNPYWNVPPDLVQRIIAPAVLKQGTKYLREAGYEVMSDWSADATPSAPEEVDWAKVASGEEQLAVRQLPGPRNSMGSMKFMFPNPLGVYLHDTPNRELFGETDRRRSAGCVRLEDAGRLARWLLGSPVRSRSNRPEEVVPVASPVPVYITYLTARPEGGRIVFNADHYNRDKPLLAQLGGRSFASAR